MHDLPLFQWELAGANDVSLDVAYIEGFTGSNPLNKSISAI